jgi:hypothetical protein
MRLIAHLFNGNLVLPQKVKDFNYWLYRLNNKPSNKESITPIPLALPLEINNSQWLAGFTDAEGCFHIRFSKNKYPIVLFELSQSGKDAKKILKQISSLLGFSSNKSVKPHGGGTQ